VLVGDPEQLQAIEAGAAFRGVLGQVGMAEMSEVRRQKDAWMREATQALSAGRTPAALHAYEGHDGIIAADTRESAREALLQRWASDRESFPKTSQLIVAYTRDDVRNLNAQARDIRLSRHELGAAESVPTNRGMRAIAVNERIMFLRNEKSLGVKNGTLATVERIDHGVLQVRMDGKDETRIIVDTRDYQDLDYGYASTIHKSQGATVDRTYVLASRYFDRHTSYVALSRHRDQAMLFWGRDEFASRAGQGASIDTAEAKRNFESVLSRARPKELAHDYLEGGWASPPLNDAIAQYLERGGTDENHSVEEIQRRARENWLAFKAQQPESEVSIDEQQRRARERWVEYQQSKGAEARQSPGPARDKDHTQERDKPSDHGIDDDLSL
jgi:ATP-dependent exoDNAse (exonuclease V) alpha subunit